jgi:hypothetical protein
MAVFTEPILHKDFFLSLSDFQIVAPKSFLRLETNKWKISARSIEKNNKKGFCAKENRSKNWPQTAKEQPQGQSEVNAGKANGLRERFYREGLLSDGKQTKISLN